MSEEFTFYKKLGRKVTEILCLTSDRLGFYRTQQGMKTRQGIGEAVSDAVNELRSEDKKVIEELLDEYKMASVYSGEGAWGMDWDLVEKMTEILKRY